LSLGWLYAYLANSLYESTAGHRSDKRTSIQMCIRDQFCFQKQILIVRGQIEDVSPEVYPQITNSEYIC